MAEQHELGRTGEELACKFLREKAYEIIKTNWRFGHDEIDIIARDREQIVFVEVKTRSSRYFGEPSTFVTRKKQQFMIRAANAYFDKYELDLEGRFDVVSIVMSDGQSNITHIERAFYPTL